MAERKAANVLPDPVGAATRTFFPFLIYGQALAWGAVGPVNFDANQFWTTAWKGERLMRRIYRVKGSSLKRRLGCLSLKRLTGLFRDREPSRGFSRVLLLPYHQILRGPR